MNWHSRPHHTIRYDAVDLRALKSWWDGQLNLAHGPETKNNKKMKTKNRVAQKKRCRQKSVEAVREEGLNVWLVWLKVSWMSARYVISWLARRQNTTRWTKSDWKQLSGMITNDQLPVRLPLNKQRIISTGGMWLTSAGWLFIKSDHYHETQYINMQWINIVRLSEKKKYYAKVMQISKLHANQLN